ncbi:MAG TPA: response regulator transcription factor [Actinomycetes bacterium]|jgi:DNA-binding NarL/FixJ family response regulator|nr:response regulator transcription factor [Actinomycetes bacterium]
MPHANTDTAAPLRVLVVDDSPWLRQTIRTVLENAGLMVVAEAANGAEALTEAAAQNPDVVLMDLGMPGMDGIQATRTLRRQQPHTPVVLWTGQDDAHLASAVRSSGARAGVPKGVCMVDLIATLRQACDTRR